MSVTRKVNVVSKREILILFLKSYIFAYSSIIGGKVIVDIPDINT